MKFVAGWTLAGSVACIPLLLLLEALRDQREMRELRDPYVNLRTQALRAFDSLGAWIRLRTPNPFRNWCISWLTACCRRVLVER